MKDWKAELDTFFQLREQQKSQEQRPDHTPTFGGPTALEEFMVAVAVPAFEEFAAALKEHGCRIRLRLGDSSMRIVSEFGGVEEFDYTLWAGTNTLSAEARSAGRRVPDSFQNAKSNSAITDTTKDDVLQHLVERYIALTTPASV